MMWLYCAYWIYTVIFGGEAMDVIISNASSQPIYEQIFAQIKNNIISGRLKEGDALPSIRVLAKDLRISVITTKRAYDELERAGYIYTVAAKGCFVAEKNVEVMREERLKEIEEHLRSVSGLAADCNLSDDEIFEIYNLIKKEG